MITTSERWAAMGEVRALEEEAGDFLVLLSGADRVSIGGDALREECLAHLLEVGERLAEARKMALSP